MHKFTFFLRPVLSWLVFIIGSLDLMLAFAAAQAREGALAKLIIDLHLPVASPEVGTTLSRFNTDLASWSGYHFFAGFAVALVGLLLVATSTQIPPPTIRTSSPQA